MIDLGPLVGEGAKASVADPELALRRSVVQQAPQPPTALGASNIGLLWLLGIGAQAEAITQWGFNNKTRDFQLRQFLGTEPTFLSALGIIISRNTAFSWKLEGPEATVSRLQRALESSNRGKGWIDLWSKVSNDLYTQDSGAFIEILRESDSPDAEFRQLNHLDASRCYHTGIDETPVIYQDWRGRYHLLKWYEVATMADMPSPIEQMYGMQYSALTRFLRYAQILKNIGIYDDEKTGGRHQRAIHLIKGITTKQIEEAVATANARLDSRGYQRFAPPAMAGSIDPTADVGHDTIDLAGVPDNFDRDSQNKWYLAFLAMAFMEDYQTFAPLPGGGLGTSNQSQILNAKSRGKGPGLYQKLVTHIMNFLVLPPNCQFSFDEQDLEADKLDAEVRGARATERAARIASQEITPLIAQSRALASGDLTQEEYDALQAVDLITDTTLQDGSDPKAQLGEGLTLEQRAVIQKQNEMAQEQAKAQQEQDNALELQRARQQAQPSGQKEFTDLEEERFAAEDAVAESLELPFSRLKERVLEALSR